MVGRKKQLRWKCNHQTMEWTWQPQNVTIFGKNFGSVKAYKGHSAVAAYLGEVKCAKTHYINDGELACELPTVTEGFLTVGGYPSGDGVRKSAFVGGQNRRAWVSVGGLTSHNPLEMENTTRNPWNPPMQYLRVMRRDIPVASTGIHTEDDIVWQATRPECDKKCDALEWCVAYTRTFAFPDAAVGPCRPRDNHSVALCTPGASPTGPDVTAWIREDQTTNDDNKCLRPHDVVMDPFVTALENLTMREEGDQEIAIYGQHFGVNGTVGAQSVEAMINGNPCYKTTWRSETELGCVVPAGIGLSEMIRLSDGFEADPAQDDEAKNAAIGGT